MMRGIVVLGILCTISSIGQNYYFDWVETAGGTLADEGYGMTIDLNENVYTVGQFSGTADFDPSISGVYNLISSGSSDGFVQKVDRNGNFIWALSIGGVGADSFKSITADSLGNVYISGAFNGTVDFDPGADSYNLTSSFSFDAFVLKLDSSGNFQWVKQFECSGNSTILDTQFSGDSAIYCMGWYSLTIDLDPSINVQSEISQGQSDFFVVKLDTSGNYIWGKVIGGPNYDQCESISLSSDGSIFLTGAFSDTVDFDPGIGTYKLYGQNSDVFILKLDYQGELVWVKKIGGPSIDRGIDIHVYNDSSIFVTGYFNDTVDFNPGFGTNLLNSNGSWDVFVLKLDTSASFKWCKKIGGLGTEYGRCITVDNSGNVIVVGDFNNNVDFSTGLGIGILDTYGGNDSFVLSLDSLGIFNWVKQVGGASYEYAKQVRCSGSNAIYVQGIFSGTCNFDPIASNDSANSAGNNDIFILKFSQCENLISTDMITACNSYTWIDGITYTSSNSSATYLLTNSNGCDSLVTLDLTIKSVDTSVTNNSPILMANAVGATYQWVDCDNGNSPIPGEIAASFTAISNGNYAVEVTQNGCTTMSGCYSVMNVSLGSLILNGISVYPNPTDGLVIVDMEGKAEVYSVVVTNQLGQVITRINATDKARLEVDLTNKPTGVYFLKFELHNGEGVAYKLMKH